MARNTGVQKRLREQVRASRGPCHICGQSIDYTLAAPDPMRFEMDHVVPLALGGRDVLSNVAASHMACNRAKAARAVAPIIKHSGSFVV